MVNSGRLPWHPPTHLTDPLANGRYVLAQDRDLTAEERRQHLLALHDAVAEWVGERGVLDLMALRMALDLYGRALESKDLIAGARALSEFIRSMGRLRLLESLRGQRSGPAGPRKRVPIARTAEVEQDAGDEPAEVEDAAEVAAEEGT